MGLMLRFAPTVCRTDYVAVADYPTAGVVMPLVYGSKERLTEHI